MKKAIALIIVLALALTLCACDASNEAPSAAAETRIITDALGREVEIPCEVRTIAPLGNAPRLLTYLGVQDRFVTITPSDTNDTIYMAYGRYNREAWAVLPIGASGGYGVFHPEVLIEADPDVILCTYELDIVEDIAAQTGLPVVAVAQGTLFGEDYEQALRIFGDVCGVSDRAEELISYINSCLADLDARCSAVPEEQRPPVLGAAATFRGGHDMSGVYSGLSVFKAICANDVAADVEKSPNSVGVEVDLEQLLVWDPEYIFLDAGNMELVRAQYEENPGFFEQLQAFKNGKAYVWPNSTSNYTNVEIPIANAYYAASILYPEAFADISFEEKAAEIFDMFIGHGSEYLQDLINDGESYCTAVITE